MAGFCQLTFDGNFFFKEEAEANAVKRKSNQRQETNQYLCVETKGKRKITRVNENFPIGSLCPKDFTVVQNEILLFFTGVPKLFCLAFFLLYSQRKLSRESSLFEVVQVSFRIFK